jgi:hypothetical protein
MGVLDTVARNVASSMVGKFGQSVLLKEKQAGSYDSATDTVSTFKLEHSVSALITEFAATEIRGLVKSGDKKVLVAAKDLPRTPTVEWVLKIGDRWYSIRHVLTSYSGDEAAVHELVARGS